MAGLKPNEIVVIFLALGVLLAVARIFGEIARKLNQPAVLGELLAGILLGPSVLGYFVPELTSYLFPKSGSVATVFGGLRTISIVLFLLVAGMEVDLSTLWRQGKAAISVGVSGIALPFSLGVILALAAPNFLDHETQANKLAFTLFMGTAMSITALPVIARTLMDLKLYRTDFGMLVIAAAMFDDLVGWILFASILGLVGQTAEHGGHVLSTIAGVIALTTTILTVVRWFVHRSLPWIQAHATWPVSILSYFIALACLGAACAEWLGIHAIFGAFLIGVAIGDSSHLREHTRNIMGALVSSFFAPLFFVSIGLGTNFVTNFDWQLTLVIISVACVAKIIGCTAGAIFGGIPRRDALAVGFAMNARGAMEIVLGLLALQAGLIDGRLFVSLVIMALVTSMICGPALRAILGLSHPKELRNYLHPKAFIRRLEATDAASAIRELGSALALAVSHNEETILRNSLQREELMSTGLSDGVAIPHARIAGLSSTVVAFGISQSGIDFNAPDGAPSHFIFLVLTPEDDKGEQTNVLSQVARTFGHPAIRHAALNVANFTELLAVLKTHAVEPAPTPEKQLIVT